MRLAVSAFLLAFAGFFTFLQAGAQDANPFDVAVVTDFDEPWSLAVMPDDRLLVTETKGNLYIVTPEGGKSFAVGGVPDVDYGGQGGLGDVALHPDFGTNGVIYLSYAEAGSGGTRGAAIMRAVLDENSGRPRLREQSVVWRQYPKMLGRGHYGHRMMFDDEGYLWVTSGDRQKFTPAQDMQSNVGKILRLNDDGSVPKDNPFVDYDSEDAFVDDGGVYAQVWSMGHRNPYGLAKDADGRLWEIEMGPAGGDEMNLIKRGSNYGYPLVSNGEHYDGRPIPNHDTRPEFEAPATWWTPVISPGDLLVYDGKAFADWRGNALIAGLSSQAIIRVVMKDDGSAAEAERYDMGARIRSIEEASDGALWVLEDEYGSSRGRLLRLTPVGN
ncbi:MAG: PQQ-dependent sugar dehydrogenase [Congregibacter sp.]